MPVRRTFIRTGLGVLLLWTAAVPLSGCALTDIFKSVETDYKIDGSTKDDDTRKYLSDILNERVREKTENLSDEADLRTRQEDYLETVIQADLVRALRAKGYYEAEVKYDDKAAPFAGTYKIEYGPKYKISSVYVTPEEFRRHLNENAVHNGVALDAQRILDEQGDFKDRIGKDSCYFSLSVKNEVYLDRRANEGEVHLLVDAGQQGVFGPVSFKGNGSVRESYLRKLQPWKEGDCYRQDKLEDYKTKLLQSGLFARAETVLPEQPAEDGSVPVTLDLRERSQRTISAGLTFYSDEGLGAVLGWEHRNFFGAAEKLKATLNLSQIEQSLNTTFDKPYFLRKDQSLSLTSSVRRRDTDAFEELGIDTGGSINRTLTRNLSASTGVNVSLLRIEDSLDNSKRTYGLLSAPQSLTYDSRDDKLDATKGWNLTALGQPFFDILGEGSPFFKTLFTGSGYLSLDADSDLVLAGRAGIGSLWGAEIENIPATERFYAGGGGSVRGFGFQEVGPQKDGDPSGGRSLVNASLELRSKFTDSIGGVAFVDAASVAENSSPSFENVAIGAGVGLRYYTGFGPIRFDVAVPLTQKDDLEQNYQFYISIGQAF